MLLVLAGCFRSTAIVVTPPPVETSLGEAPVSAPRGEPVTIAFAPPKVGERRVRTMIEHATTDDNDPSLPQVAHSEFELHEEILEVRGGVTTRLRVLAVRAERPDDATALQGVFLVSPPREGNRDLTVTRESGEPVKSSEAELVDELVGSDLRWRILVEILQNGRTLRVGESVELTSAEKRLLDDANVQRHPLWLSLVGIDAATVTYQFDTRWRGDVAGMASSQSPTSARIRVVLERASGRPLEHVLINQSHHMGAHQQVVTTVRFRYPESATRSST